ncbi:Uncharacterized conserved protein YbjQ, UPF0145 family [Micromonospora pattaloongensis]|uniref:Uncharacterized conserved protein YbjQ, UPF0145 family n=1 Tax=Micromonospora pattaloongensis TaxID=405436 RepID=A0A1H3I8K5_9ACTN|nr:Uncharacterized conserved protein YbjQ, UPF0145 family [Micromonospora pattaloongensis]
MTTNDLPGFEIRAVLGEVVVSAVRSINPFKEGVKSLRGGKSDPQGADNLTKYRMDAITKLGQAAQKKGANAVLGMRFDCREVGPTHIELCAYGTAAVVLQIRPEPDKPEKSHPQPPQGNQKTGSEQGTNAAAGSTSGGS